MTEKITAVTSLGHIPRKVIIKSNTIFSSVISIPKVPAESEALSVNKLEVLETVDGFHLESILIDFPPNTNGKVMIDNGSLTAILVNVLNAYINLLPS